MDLKQLEYIVSIDNEKSISKAADKLFITQSALNQQLLKLEKELGVQLFVRRSHAMTPTFAGKIYLSSARRMLDMKNETYKIIHDIADEQVGEIHFSHDQTERGHQDVTDKRGYNLSERPADDDANRQVQDVAAHDKFPEFFHHRAIPPFRNQRINFP